MATKSVLFEYWRQKEIERGKRITVTEVSREIGLHRDTIQKLLDDATGRYDKPVLDALCRYFDVPPGPVPFLVYEPDENHVHERD